MPRRTLLSSEQRTRLFSIKRGILPCAMPMAGRGRKSKSRQCPAKITVSTPKGGFRLSMPELICLNSFMRTADHRARWLTPDTHILCPLEPCSEPQRLAA
jgi:hypothetical protein